MYTRVSREAYHCAGTLACREACAGALVSREAYGSTLVSREAYMLGYLSCFLQL